MMAPPLIHEVLRSPGQPLDAKTRAFMEPRFGHDFSKVRIHTDRRSAESAQAINALAYTVGQRIVFGAGQYNPETSVGQHLLAHELTHTVQQNNSQLRRQRPRVKISNVIVSTDTEQARLKARELATLIKAGEWKSEYAEQLEHWLEFFEEAAWRAFVFEIGEVLGEKITGFEGEPKAHPEGIYAAVAKESVVIPTSKPKVVRGGFQVTYFAQISEETSNSTSVEVYSDMSGSAEFSIELPIKKIAKFKIGGGVRKGRKETEKEEEKKATRIGRTISRSFTVQKLEREIFRILYLKTYHGVSAPSKGIGLPEGELASRLTREREGVDPHGNSDGLPDRARKGGWRAVGTILERL